MAAAISSPQVVSGTTYTAEFATQQLTLIQRRPAVAKGDKIPDVALSRITAAGVVENFSTATEMSGTLDILITVPGAFTKTCSKLHVPSFVDEATVKKLHALGVTNIFCMGPNDRDVMNAWQQAIDPKFTLRMIPDYGRELTLKMGIGMDKAKDRHLGYIPERRLYIISKGIITHSEIDKDASQCTVTSGNYLVDLLSPKVTVVANAPLNTGAAAAVKK